MRIQGKLEPKAVFELDHLFKIEGQSEEMGGRPRIDRESRYGGRNMPGAGQRGLQSLSGVLNDLFVLRGLARRQARRELDVAWEQAVGETAARQTHVGEPRRGVLEITVGSSALLAELSGFRKQELLAALRRNAAASTIRDIRFRLGVIEDPTARDDQPVQMLDPKSPMGGYGSAGNFHPKADRHSR